MIYFYPPNKPQLTEPRIKIFLAGSIEMDTAENWQEKVLEVLEEEDIVVLNPRRPDWDVNWKQEKSDPHFNEQVNWELDMLEGCDLIAMYFDPNTKSPISLLELGMFAALDKKIIVCCPEGFWRKGNVDIVCDRFNLVTCDTFDDFLSSVKLGAKILKAALTYEQETGRNIP